MSLWGVSLHFSHSVASLCLPRFHVADSTICFASCSCLLCRCDSPAGLHSALSTFAPPSSPLSHTPVLRVIHLSRLYQACMLEIKSVCLSRVYMHTYINRCGRHAYRLQTVVWLLCVVVMETNSFWMQRKNKDHVLLVQTQCLISVCVFSIVNSMSRVCP